MQYNRLKELAGGAFSLLTTDNHIGSPGLQKLAQRTSLQVNQRGRAVFIKLAVAF